MRNLVFILLLCSASLNAQLPNQGYDNDATFFLGDMENSWTVGNECGIDNFMDVIVDGDMNMNNYLLQVRNARITISGNIVNEGVTEFYCDNAEIIEQGVTLDVDDTERNELKIFPIPTSGDLHINGLGIKTIVVYNMSGIQVKWFRTPTTYNIIDMSDLPSGIYIVMVNDITKKVIKK